MDKLPARLSCSGQRVKGETRSLGTCESEPIPEDLLNVTPSVEDRNDLQGRRRRPIDYQVRIDGKEFNFFICEIYSVMAGFRGARKEGELFTNDCFDMIRHTHTASFGYVPPDVGKIGHSLGRKKKTRLHSLFAFNLAR